MKAKVIPLLASLILLTALCYGGWLAITGAPLPVKVRDIFASRHHKVDFVVPSAREAREVKDITKKLILIAYPPTDAGHGVDLRLFGRQQAVRQNYVGVKLPAAAPEFAYDISFTFVSDENQYCYINNSFYKQGDVMADGGQISKIKLQKVLIVKNHVSQWVPVRRQRYDNDRGRSDNQQSSQPAK